MRDTVGGEDATYTAEWDSAIHSALNTLDELKESEPFDNVSWIRGTIVILILQTITRRTGRRDSQIR